MKKSLTVLTLTAAVFASALSPTASFAATEPASASPSAGSQAYYEDPWYMNKGEVRELYSASGYTYKVQGENAKVYKKKGVWYLEATVHGDSLLIQLKNGKPVKEYVIYVTD
ncbi:MULTISPECIES: hypothetical protein [Paenibacillus]|uniref:Uncharacterized protein n=1 Tax=Paenibacillus oleatilyticus TaxID=2594886 RepID=A0ABV4V5J3_9BACL|nr:hypothetical protein [Paenibacillus sp. A3]KPV56425.1 hypothetical protein QJ48_27795 [Paenibacillus sp. A3]